MNTQHTAYRDMTDAQMLAWGEAEAMARIADLDGVKSAEALKAAQAACEVRRKAIGATRGQASDMVIRANREKRVKEWRAAQAAQPKDAA